MSEPLDYEKYAEDLIKQVSEMQHRVLLKHSKAILEEMHSQLKDRDKKLNRLQESCDERGEHMKIMRAWLKGSDTYTMACSDWAELERWFDKDEEVL